MYSLAMLRISTMLLVYCAGSLVGIVLCFLFRDRKSHSWYRIQSLILLPLSVLVLGVILFTKEKFHWNFDIATGEAVDHYSTYAKCLVMSVVSGLCSISSVFLSRFFKPKD